MRITLLPVFLAATSAAAQGAGDFRSTAPITPAGNDALHRVTVPYEAYRDARRDLADIRIFNKDGAELPIAFAAAPDAARETPPAIALPMFPVSAAAQGGAATKLDVQVRSDPDGTLVSVQGRRQGATAPRPSAWLLDASQVKKALRALTVEWDVGPGTEIAKLTVEASDDLKSWRTIAARAPVVRLQQGGQQLSQPRVEVGSLRAKYLRVTAEPSTFVLRAVLGEPEEVVTPAPRAKRVVAATPGAKAGEYEVDLGARLPVEAVRVLLPEANSVAPFTLSWREGASGDWRPAVTATFYRLNRDGTELESAPVEVVRAARYWMLHLDPRGPALASAPSLEVQWRAAQIVFVARGAGPYQLAFGNAEARRAVLALNEIIPNYEPRAEAKLPEARVGEVHSVERASGLWQRVFGDAAPRKVLLWAILLAAVLALAAMAWRLARQMRETPRGPEG